MSLMLRIPPKAKPFLAPVFMQLERIWNRIPVRQVQAIFVAQWKKRTSVAGICFAATLSCRPRYLTGLVAVTV
jgi:hypothetical protein